MNNTAPNKWLVFVQWAIALQWIKLSVTTLASPAFTRVFVSYTRDVHTSDILSGYNILTPFNALDYSRLLTDMLLYGGSIIGVALVLGGAWMLFHKPVKIRSVTLMIIVLLMGATLSTILHVTLGSPSAPLYNTAFLMGILQLILVSYYVGFHRYKKRNQGTNLQYAKVGDVH